MTKNKRYNKTLIVNNVDDPEQTENGFCFKVQFNSPFVSNSFSNIKSIHINTLTFHRSLFFNYPLVSLHIEELKYYASQSTSTHLNQCAATFPINVERQMNNISEYTTVYNLNNPLYFDTPLQKLQTLSFKIQAVKFTHNGISCAVKSRKTPNA